jgi:hypothetical protein
VTETYVPKEHLVPATKQASPPKPTPADRGAHGRRALDGLEVSLEDAQKAIAELRRDLSTGGRRLVQDVETAVKAARRDLRRSRKQIQGDLTDLGGALTPRRGTRPAAKPRARAGGAARSS